MPSFPKLGTGRFSLPFVKRLDRYLKSLSAGDRYIAYFLGWIVVATSLVGIYALERSFLIEVPARGGSLTEGIVGTPRFVNPLLASTDTDRDLVALTYAGLMGHGPDGSLIPVLAEKYEVAPSGAVYTFTLRKDAKFSDGSPVTADDVVYTVQKAQDQGLKSPVLSNWANIRAEAVDARTVRFTLPRPYAPFLEDTTLGILPSRLWKGLSNTEFPFSPMNTVPIGAGPFTVRDVTRGKNGVITAYHLHASNTYWPRAYLDEMHLVFYQDLSSLQAAVRKGAVDSAYGVATDDALQSPYARIFGVFFNPAKTPLFQKIEVRKALSLAVDREGLVYGTLGGYATPSMGPVPGSTVPLPNQETRLAEARAALTAAKWTFDEEAGVWKNGSETLAVTLQTSNVPELKAIATRVKEDWEAFGVPTTIEFHDPSELTQKIIRPRAYGALLFGEVVGRTPDLYAFWSSKERTDPGLNIANYANPQVDTILDRMRSERDATKLAADLAEADRRIAADYPAVFLYTPDFVYSVPKDLRGVSLAGIAAPTDRFSNVANWYRHTELVWPVFARSSR